MKFDLEPDVVEMADAVSAFAANRLAGPATGDLDSFRGRWRLLAEQGLTGMPLPVEYGGGGLDAVASAALTEALGYGCPDTGLAFSLAAHLYACLVPLNAFASQRQRRELLPGLASGQLIAAHAITEPEAGSQAFNLSTTAQRQGQHYVLNGNKCFVTNAPVADVFIVQCTTNRDAGYFGLTSFVVMASNPGLRVGPPHAKVGLHGSPTADVWFDNCVVPVDAVLGEVGGGAGVFGSSMAWERTCLFAAFLGAMRRLIESTSRYVREREQFGVAIGTFQAVSHEVVNMHLRYEAARLMLYRSAAALANGSVDELLPAMAKIAVSEAAVATGLAAVQLRGALGVLDGEAETFLRDALPSRIFSGTNEIQRNNIARVLGLADRPVLRKVGRR
ncbi:MAG: acyl-CoA dehydrogenase family protein [Jatrophihabitantaceae bacterium]